MATILTLDLGTTYFKAALFDHQGGLIALQRVALPVQHPRPDRWELPAEAFRSVIIELLHELRQSAPEEFADAAALSFATQTNSFLLLDSRDEALTPILIWPDGRAVGHAGALEWMNTRSSLQARTGVPKIESQFMLPKLLWLRDRQPDVWQRSARLCLLSDYLTRWFTGQHVSEAGAAGLTGALDIHQLEWCDEVIDSIRLSRAWLPRVIRAASDLGPILAPIAQSLNLPPSCRFVVGCLDQYAGAIGLGCAAPGALCETTGTVLATVRYADTFDPNAPRDVFQGPAATAGSYYQMIFGSTSANLLEQYRESLPTRPSFVELDRLAQGIPPGAEGLRAIGSADGVLSFVDQQPGHTVGHHVRAILETVAFALSGQVTTLCGSSPPKQIRSGGGAARSDLWLQIKADVLNLPVSAVRCPEPTSMGAAILAGTALGWGGIGELAADWVRPERTFEPRPDIHQAYQQIRDHSRSNPA